MFATNQDGHSFVSDALKKEFALDWNPPTSKKEQIAKELELWSSRANRSSSGSRRTDPGS